MKNKKCSVCDQVFSCAALDKGASCWCTAYPVLKPVDPEQDCLCASCLEKAVAKNSDQTMGVNDLNHG